MGRGRKSTTQQDLRQMKRSSINGGDGDGGGGDGSVNDDESIRSHDSGKYLGASGGEHSSDDDGHNYKGSPDNDDHDESAHYAAKHRFSLEDSEEGLYESDDGVNENNVNDENQIDERKPAARKSASSRKKLSTKR